MRIAVLRRQERCEDGPSLADLTLDLFSELGGDHFERARQQAEKKTRRFLRDIHFTMMMTLNRKQIGKDAKNHILRYLD